MTQAEELLQKHPIPWRIEREPKGWLQQTVVFDANNNYINYYRDENSHFVWSAIVAIINSQKSSVVNEGVISWEEACEQVAKENNAEHWNDLIGSAVHGYYTADVLQFCSQAAHLFMQANRVSRWIPVEERLPEEDEEVTVVIEHVTCKDRHVRTMRLAPYMFQCWIFYDNSVLGSIYKVILWQPLPEIPKQ